MSGREGKKKGGSQPKKDGDTDKHEEKPASGKSGEKASGGKKGNKK